MTDSKRNHSKSPTARLLVLAMLLALVFEARAGASVILFLKNGDRVAGDIVSEDTNHVVLTNSWAGNLSARFKSEKINLTVRQKLRRLH